MPNKSVGGFGEPGNKISPNVGPNDSESDGREKGEAHKSPSNPADAKSVGVEPNDGLKLLDGHRKGLD